MALSEGQPLLRIPFNNKKVPALIVTDEGGSCRGA